MLTLINTNRMLPPVAPIGLDYIAASARHAGIETDVLDLCLLRDPSEVVRQYFAAHAPSLVGLSFRNVDDCFWPSADWFVPQLADTVAVLRTATDAPIVIGGVGFSIFAQSIVEYTGADFGIKGDGEKTVVSLINELQGRKRFGNVPGLIWRRNSLIHSNTPAWPAHLSLPTGRDAVDNLTYLRQGGQCGLETKRGCNRRCIYCADPLAKGPRLRLRSPSEVADEVESLLRCGIDVFHLCDSEFNVPRRHAWAVCEEFNRRSLGSRIRWYAYLSVVPFDSALVEVMRRAGCAGIDFTGDSACESMLQIYRQRHNKDDIASAVRLCRDNGIAVMIDLLIGGPGETPQTVRETIDFIKQINPDCAGAALGVRLYPNTIMADIVTRREHAGVLGIHRKYEGPLDLLKPTFYISPALGERPAKLVKDLIAGDQRFFEPAEPMETVPGYNYNDNTPLIEAIKKGARGAYWHILRKLR